MDTNTIQKILFDGCFRSPNRTYPLMKTFQGGKTKIFALLQGRKDFELTFLLLKLLAQTRKKHLIQISHDSFFMWRDTEFQ